MANSAYPVLCGRQIPSQKFLCNKCANAAVQAQIVTVGTDLDKGSSTAAATALALIVAALKPNPPV